VLSCGTIVRDGEKCVVWFRPFHPGGADRVYDGHSRNRQKKISKLRSSLHRGAVFPPG